MRIFSLYLTYILYVTHVSAVSKQEQLRQNKFPPCRACKTFIESFKKGMEKTERGKFEGGDAAWEEEKLGSYSGSEIRLVEIQEYVCSDVEEGRDQCYSLHEEYDSIIEEWWFKHQKTEPDLFKYFCIDNLKQCCPENHYGSECKPCPGYPDNVCGSNGKCRGSGTRKGNGTCLCDAGYKGDLCNDCSDGYYNAYQDDKKLICSKCHVSCEGRCSKAGPVGCEKCAQGWLTTKENGCVDINECAEQKFTCGQLQFCVNTEGSYKCLECDKSCTGCTGDGPDMCLRCANGYVFVNNVCVDEEQENKKKHVYLTRYLTYLGLCIATCIIFQKSVTLAAIIGVAVACYISMSEYILNSPGKPNTTDLAEKLMQGMK